MTTPPRQLLGQHVTQRVERLQEGLTNGLPLARKQAAILRRSITKQAGSEPEVFDLTLGGLPEELVGKGDKPSRGESIAHLCISLYALQMQSAKSPAHIRGIGLGTALRTYIRHEHIETVDESPIIRRIRALFTADDLDEAAQHLRGLIQQIRGTAGVGMDFGTLAQDLWQFSFPQSRDNVRLKWSRDLYSTATLPADSGTPSSNSIPEQEITKS